VSESGEIPLRQLECLWLTRETLNGPLARLNEGELVSRYLVPSMFVKPSLLRSDDIANESGQLPGT
jgi:hypothetical protein